MTVPGAANRRDDRGMVLPSTVMFLSLVVVAVAAIVFMLTSGPKPPSQADLASQEPTASATPTTPPPTAVSQPTQKPKPEPKVNRKQTLVVVFNNSNVSGLAGRTATKVQNAGWNVVGSDNWYGTITASTVYYPQRLEAAGRLLAKDLGIGRVKPAIEPMQFDRLTVVLTGDFRES